MKKFTVILICLVASLLLTGVAFASWSLVSDVIVNAGTANLDVKIIKATTIYASNGVDFSNQDIIIGNNDKTVNINIDGIYPGSKATLELIVENTGSLPVSFDQIIQKFNDVIDTKTGANLGQDSNLLRYIVISYDVELIDFNGQSLQALHNVSATGESAINHLYLDNSLEQIKPEQFVKIIMNIQMDESASNDTMNKQFSFVVSPLFVQH